MKEELENFDKFKKFYNLKSSYKFENFYKLQRNKIRRKNFTVGKFCDDYNEFIDYEVFN